MTGRATPQWATKGTASVMSLRPLVALARERHIEIAPLLALADLTPSMLDEYDRRIPEAVCAQIWVAAAERSRDPLFGLHVAERSQLGVYDVLDYALYFSPTVGEGIENIVRFHRILSDSWALDVEYRAKTTQLRRIERTPPPECEAALATLVLRARTLTTKDLAPSEVRFEHRGAADPKPYVEWFGCPVQFAAATSEMIIPSSHLDVPVPTGNPAVERILGRYMAEILARLPKTASYVELVRNSVARKLHHRVPTLAQTARELHASPRTVQRRLGEHGMSYSTLVENVRRDMAERLLGDGRASVTEIAFLLGFSDVSGFRRMYKRLTGVTPKSVAAKKKRGAR